MVFNMKNHKKLAIITFSMFLVFLLFTPSVKCATNIEDTTFPGEVGDIYTWEVIYSINPEQVGDYFNFTTEAIYKDQYASVDSLIVNCSLKYYNTTTSLWINEYNNSFYMAANQTQQYYALEPYFIDSIALFLIPTPINLTAFGLIFSTNPRVSAYSVDGNILRINTMPDFALHEFTFSSSGILTSYEAYFTYIGQTKVFEMILITPIDEGNGDEEIISLGSYFLIFTLISVIGLVCLKKFFLNN